MATQRLQGESTKAYAAYQCYRDFGVDRSLEKVGKKLGKSAGLMERWSALYRWVARAAEWDAEQEGVREEARQAKIKKVMSKGFANAYKRVKYLDMLAKRQWEDMQEKDKVWLPDVKQIGGGEFAERVDIIRYNAALDAEFRATLDDLAKETGGRVKKAHLAIENMTNDELIKFITGQT